MEEALQRSQGGDLKVSVLLDYSRGSRGSPLPLAALLITSKLHSSLRLTFLCPSLPSAGEINSRTMLLPLLRRFTSQMRVSLYHTPDLRGLLRLLVPQRFNETIGVQHIKVYLFDDSVIISGCVRDTALLDAQSVMEKKAHTQKNHTLLVAAKRKLFFQSVLCKCHFFFYHTVLKLWYLSDI